MVGAYTVGMDQPVLDLLREEEVPLVGPFTLDPGDEIVNAAAFYLYRDSWNRRGCWRARRSRKGRGSVAAGDGRASNRSGSIAWWMRYRSNWPETANKTP